MSADSHAARFARWCAAHGYADVLDAEPSRVSLARLDEAVAAYARACAIEADNERIQFDILRRGDAAQQWIK